MSYLRYIAIKLDLAQDVVDRKMLAASCLFHHATVAQRSAILQIKIYNTKLASFPSPAQLFALLVQKPGHKANTKHLILKNGSTQ